MLSEVSYQQIVGNYWYGMYGEFNVILMKDSGYINATKLCNAGAKNFCDWNRNKTSKLLLQALEDKLNVDEALENRQHLISDLDSTLGDRNLKIIGIRSNLYKFVNNFNHTTTDQLISGTYSHPLLAPHIACWVSPYFAIKVSAIVNNYFIAEYQSKLQETRYAFESIAQELITTKEVLSVTQQSLASQSDQVQIKHETISDLSNEITKKEVQHNQWASTHAFTLLKINDVEAILPYYVIRCLRGKVTSSINKLRLKHPRAQVIWQQHKIPNAVNLYSRLKSDKSIHTTRNYCIPSNDEAQFINKLNDLAGNDYTCNIYTPFNDWVPN